MKVCIKCKKEKDKNDFHKNSRSKDGLQIKCKDCFKEYSLKNREQIRLYNKNWRSKNRDRVNLYRRNRSKENPLYKIKTSLCSLTYLATVRPYKKSSKTFRVIGVTHKELMRHLESVNYTDVDLNGDRSKWAVDHITPLSSANTKEELLRLCHYTNLQPLSIEDNLKKSNN
jgi:NAD-dependent SIR2 family protein deacetylase